MNIIQRFDQAIYKCERWITGWISLSMALIVFLDVVHRIFSRKPGRISILLSPVLNRNPEDLEIWISSSFIFVCIWVIGFAAVKTRNKAVGNRKAGLKSFFATVVLSVIVQAFLHFMPEGLVWSPYLGLSALLWIGLLGSSMAAYHGQHLAMELGEKIWPQKLLPSVKRLNHLLVGVFCAFLAVLALTSLLDHFNDWNSGPGAGLIPAIGWPKWIVFLVIPYAFGMMTLRYMWQSLGLTQKVEAQQ